MGSNVKLKSGEASSASTSKSTGGSKTQNKKQDRPKLTEEQLVGKRADLPTDAYVSKDKESQYPRRRPGNTPGKAHDTSAHVNVFRVKKYPTKNIHQYSVSVQKKVADGDPKTIDDPARGLAEKLWNHPTVQSHIGSRPDGIHWIFNGSSMAWSTPKMTSDEEEIEVDLSPGSERMNIFILTIKHSKAVMMSSLEAYLNNNASWDKSVLECMNFLDHALRQAPSQRLRLIGKNFYDYDVNPGQPLDLLTEVVKGGFASFRISRNPDEKNDCGLVVNVDVANTAFWQPLELLDAIDQLVPMGRLVTLQQMLLPTRDQQGNDVEPRAFHHLKRLIKLKFRVSYEKKDKVKGKGKRTGNAKAKTNTDDNQNGTIHTIEGFLLIRNCGEAPMRRMSSFLRPSKGHSKWYPLAVNPCPDSEECPLPLEVCKLVPLQKFRYKLDPDQTSSMITHAVTDPWVRKGDIEAAVASLGWGHDDNLTGFGIEIGTDMVKSQPRKLEFPTITYGKDKFKPKQVDFNLKGRKFFLTRKLKRTAFVSLVKACEKENLLNYAREFKRIYEMQGGSVDKSYKADCHGLSKLSKGGVGYWANICLKVNAKLGGLAYVTTPALPAPLEEKRTMMIGLDVSHGSPGSGQPSMAAMSVSLDASCAFYVARCQTNCYRKEIVDENTMTYLLKVPLEIWIKRHSKTPRHLLFFRDGVSEGQFQAVLETEVTAIKAIFRKKDIKDLEVTVIVATKRHHIRAFIDNKEKAKKAAENQSGGGKSAYGNRFPSKKPYYDKPDPATKDFINPDPGTLIEDVATHPKHWDFYLYSHKAIQGTSRPVHYHVIKDEIKFAREQLTDLIYQQCYQYCRCPSPVSLHPAVFYAHLASNRAKAHLQPSTESTVDKGPTDAAPPLCPVGQNLQATMWFV
ncbi:piwi domain-containing protein [Apiospora hydei]|uniref:Piwi domain-containing protein n=1 Tax=Apiospora hydei TaxID=1337664 RepID=A0ABR1W837_9PEZI